MRLGNVREHDMYLLESTAHVPQTNRAAVLRIWQDTNQRDHGKTGGTLRQRRFKWAPLDWTTLNERQIAEAIGFTTEDRTGDPWFVGFDHAVGDEQFLLNQVGHLIEGQMQFVRDDNHYYRYWFGPDGMHIAEGRLTSNVIYGPRQRVNPPERNPGPDLTLF